MKFNIASLFFFLSLAISLSGQDKNIALNKPAFANSENTMYPAKNVVDGKITRHSKWMSGNVNPPHILEIDLQKYCNISSIVVHTGIPLSEQTPSEAGQAAGFWSAKNFKLQYWDDANWTDIPKTEVHENRLITIPFSFSTSLNTFKIRFVCDDGEPISVMEVEVFGKETDRVLAGSTSSLEIKTERRGDQELTLKVNNQIVGKSMKYVGYNQGYYMPGSNVSGWIEYAGVNSLRVWTSLNSYVPVNAVQVDNSISSVEEFDRRKTSLRLNPEKNDFIKWDLLLPLYDDTEKAAATNPMVLNYVLSELKRLKNDPLLQINSTDFNDTWSNKWQQWQRYYALAYYAAKVGDVTMFAMQNEPNHKASGPLKLDQWIGGMQIVSDALKCAIEDVNKKYGKQLNAKMVGPVTAGNNTEWWAAVAKNMRTDYHGKPLDEDLLGIFSTHSYNSPAAGYSSRVTDIRKIIADNHPDGKELPVVFTEIGRWMNAYLIDKEETMDSPSLFTEWAGIYTNNTLNGGYGQWAFKFSNTISDVYAYGVKSGHHYTWQGKRIIEDAYTNLALNRKVTASFETQANLAKLVADGNKSDLSAWYSDSTASPKWVEIDLGTEKSLASAVVYTGSSYGVYTAPDRVRNFSLQYFSNGTWIDIPGFTLKENKYAQVFKTFSQSVISSKIRFFSEDPGILKVREIKLFAQGDGPAENEKNYDVSGIQRTGEVVRLFAEGFKNERPLFETIPSVKDPNFDAMTSFDETSGNYYLWLVQRGIYTNKIKIDLSNIEVETGAPVSGETVSPDHFGEVTFLNSVPSNKLLSFDLSPQSVVLLTIPKVKTSKTIVKSSTWATASYDGQTAEKGRIKKLNVSLDASLKENNKAAYLWFDISEIDVDKAQRVFLHVNGQVNKGETPFRMHVYGIPSVKWDPASLNHLNAPLLDPNEALIKEVGRKAFIAGEIAFGLNQESHKLDVTDLVKKHGGEGISFAFIRETRQMGDDADKGREAILNVKGKNNIPRLEIWLAK